MVMIFYTKNFSYPLKFLYASKIKIKYSNNLYANINWYVWMCFSCVCTWISVSYICTVFEHVCPPSAVCQWLIPVSITPMKLVSLHSRCGSLSATMQPLIVIFSKQMGAHSRTSAAASAHQCLQASRDTRGLIGNRSHTHTHSHFWLDLHIKSCWHGSEYIQSMLHMHTLSHSKLLVPHLIDCGTISHTHLHFCLSEASPSSQRKHLRVGGRGSVYCFLWRAWETTKGLHGLVMKEQYRHWRKERMRILHL